MQWLRSNALCGGLALMILAVATAHDQETRRTGKGLDANTVTAYEKLSAPVWWFSERRSLL